MSRVILLILFLLWVCWDETIPKWLLGTAPGGGERVAYLFGPLGSVATFLLGYVLLILGMGVWSRLLARRISDVNFHRSLRRFNKMMGVARAMIPVWFGLGLLLLGWHYWIETAVQSMTSLYPVEGRPQLDRFFTALSAMTAPASIAGTLPAFLAWAGLWWSQYPADRALREQNLLLQLEQDIPIHSPPPFWSYFASNLRLQLLFVLAPIVALMLLRDLIAFAWVFRTGTKPPEWMELVVSVSSFGLVFLLAPVLLTRVLKTESLPDSPLRRKLDQMCRAHGLKYRDILLWHTQSNMGNAAVMGVIPGLRYVLLSDLLLETMTDEQIEGVFAHELGHIVYRHMIWYVVFLATLLMAIGGPGQQVFDYVMPHLFADPDRREVIESILSPVLMAAGITLFFVLFGFVSRKFERQADVFAARVMESAQQGGTTAPATLPARRHDSVVGTYGATLFASALHRVAIINNIPIAARSWCHGSIEKRMRFLKDLGRDPKQTFAFDHFMRRIYTVMVVSLILSAACLAVVVGRDGFNNHKAPAVVTPTVSALSK